MTSRCRLRRFEDTAVTHDVPEQQEGRNAIIVIPDRAAPDSPAFKLGFRNFFRVEGTFRVDPKVKVGTVQVRIFETGSAQAKATQSVTLGS